MEIDELNNRFSELLAEYYRSGVFTDEFKELIIKGIELCTGPGLKKLYRISTWHWNFYRSDQEKIVSAQNFTYVNVIQEIESKKILQHSLYTGENGSFSNWLKWRVMKYFKREIDLEQNHYYTLTEYDPDYETHDFHYKTVEEVEKLDNEQNLLYFLCICWIKAKITEKKEDIKKLKGLKKPYKNIENKITDLQNTIGLISLLEISRDIGDSIGDVFKSLKKDVQSHKKILKNLLVSARNRMSKSGFTNKELEGYVKFSMYFFEEAAQHVIDHTQGRWDANIHGKLRNQKAIMREFFTFFDDLMMKTKKNFSVTELDEDCINRLKIQVDNNE